MKDHELRELINDVTAVARIYAHTQQLREQISQLITPAFRKLEEDRRRLKIPEGMTGDLISAAEKYASQYNNDDRQDVFTDVLNAFYHGAEFGLSGHHIDPDFADGHDCEGFVGGCERMGCPGGLKCAELPANKKS